MNGCISVINSGSSSVKFSLFDQVEKEQLRLVFSGQVEGIGVVPHFKARNAEGHTIEEQFWEQTPAINHQWVMAHIIDWIRKHRMEMGLALVGVGHRVVHGGELYSAPVLVDEQVLATLDRFIPLAPLHQPHNLNSIRTVMQLGPEIRQVACFDTAFHRTNPPVAQQFALPRSLSDEGIRRYGFHGLSYEYIAGRFQILAPEEASGRVIVAHLGSGASLCALNNGFSVAGTMGFSAMDGLVMGTRPGNLDPGVVLYLLQEKGMSAAEISDLFYKQSGLLGVSGISNDMRVLLESSEPHARDAVDLFVYRIRREIGSLAAALGGLDALIFTAGIGENSPAIRALICETVHWLGVRLDAQANELAKTKISAVGSQVSAWVIPTNEELMIASHTRDLLLH